MILELIIATIGIIISISSFLWLINRASKKDFDDKLMLKVDKDLLDEKLRFQHQKIVTQEMRLLDYESKSDEKFKKIYENLDYLRDKSDQIFTLLNKMK